MAWYNDLYQAVTGNPDAIKESYDNAIKMSQGNSAQIRDFLMAGKGAAQQYYAPLQHLFRNAYGTEGIAGPRIPGVPSSGAPQQAPFNSMYGGKR